MVEQEMRVGDWLQTRNGVAFWPLDPRPEEVLIHDIAWALAHQCRYAGHTLTHYSVAEHSVLISQSVQPELALWGLLHDSSEAYLVDIPRPLKPFLPEYRVIEERLMRCIAEKFGLDWPEPLAVKEADTRILHNEKAALMVPEPLPWNVPGDPLPNIEIQGWPPDIACREFLGRFYQLVGTSGVLVQ